MSLALSDATPFGAEWAVLRSLKEVRFGLMEGRHTRSNRAAMLAAYYGFKLPKRVFHR